MSGTYTLAEIHERHVNLERLASDIQQIQADTSLLALVADEPRAGVSDRFMSMLSFHLPAFLAETLNTLEEEISLARAQLKTDATAAYVAFMGGE